MLLVSERKKDSCLLFQEVWVKEIVFAESLLKEELFKGPFIDNAPDLVLLSNQGYDLKGMVSKNEVFGRTNLSGMHSQDNAFFYSSNGSECKSIFNVKEIIFNHMVG